MQDDFSRVHSFTPCALKHKTRTPHPDHPQHEYVHLGVSSPNPMRALRISPKGHGPRAFFGDTIQDAQVERYGAVDGADALQMMVQTAQGRYSAVHDQCPTLGMTSVYNAVDSDGRGLLSTFKHHTDPAQDWATAPKATHPYHEKVRKNVLKKPTDPHLLRCSQLQVRARIQTAAMASIECVAKCNANLLLELGLQTDRSLTLLTSWPVIVAGQACGRQTTAGGHIAPSFIDEHSRAPSASLSQG